MFLASPKKSSAHRTRSGAAYAKTETRLNPRNTHRDSTIFLLNTFANYYLIHFILLCCALF